MKSKTQATHLDIWQETQTLLELLHADSGIHDHVHLLKTLILKKFNLAELQIYAYEQNNNFVQDLTFQQQLPIQQLKSSHFKALYLEQQIYGKIHQESHPKIFWFTLKARPQLGLLFVGEGDFELSQFEFEKLQVLLMTWEQWRSVETTKAENRALKSHLSSIKRISDSLSQSYLRDDILLQILETAKTLSGARTGYIFILNAEKQILELRWVKGLPNPNAEEAVNKGLINLEGVAPKEGIVGQVFSTGISKRETFEGSGVPLDSYDTSHLISTLCVPLVLDSEVLGVIRLTVENKTKSFDDTDQNLVEILAANASSVLKRALLYEQTITDSLTGLHNRKHFEEFIQMELPRVRRYKHPATLLMMDIDHFKRINDTFGHHIGDQVLRGVAQALKLGLREMDLLARLGGEEFALLLPETTLENSRTVGERIRQQVKAMPFQTAQGEIFHVSISIGMAEIPTHRGVQYDEIYACADSALYDAKKSGRDQVKSAVLPN